MDLASAPGLTHALRNRGYRVRGPVGLGASGPAWAADASDGQRTVVTVLDLSGLTLVARRAALERVEKLRALRHPHVVALLDVVPIDAHRTALVTAALDGPTIGAVLEVRPRWRAGEVVTLVAPVAEAVNVLRAAGLRHGDIAPENVVLAPGGRPVLIDLASSVLGVPVGTPGFAAPGAPDDVFSLARLGLAALGPADDDETETAGLRVALEAGCAADLRVRPAPLDLARACFDATHPVPIEIPDAAVLTRAALTRLAEHRPQVRTVQDPRVARRRRVLVAAGAVAATAALVATLGAVGGPDGRAGDGDVQVARPVGGGAVDEVADELPPGLGEADPEALVAAAVELTHRRAELLSERSSERLDDVALPGSAAFEADQALLASLEERPEELDVRAEDVEARWVGSRGGRELVLVTSRLHVTGVGRGAPARSVVLALTETAAGWRVVDVLEPDDPAALNGPVGPLAG